jgi:excisionase family DNA binding protein
MTDEINSQARLTVASNQESLSSIKLLTLQQVADLLGFHYETVRLMVHRGDIQAMQEGPGASIRVRPDAVKAYIQNHTLRAQDQGEDRRGTRNDRTVRRR